MRYLPFLGLIGASVAIWWRPFLAVVHLAATNDAYTHILLIPPLTAGMICPLARQSKWSYEQGAPLGVFLLGAALFLDVLAVRNLETSPAEICLAASICAAVIWWVGSASLCFGLQVFPRFLFPLCFLFLTVPFPALIASWLSRFLQYQSAVATSILFHAARVPVMREGVLLSIPGLDIEVANECSSIRSSMCLIVVAMFLAQLFLRSSWRKALLILVAIPLSIAKNAFRIFTIAELGTRVDPAFLDGWLHHHGGIIFLAVGIIATGVLVWLLRHGDSDASLARRVENISRVPCAAYVDS